MEVGKKECSKREVTELNHELYNNAMRVMEDGCRLSHIGWVGVGDFIDWLELNYYIKKKGE